MKRPATKRPAKPLDIVMAMETIFASMYAGESWNGWKSILRAAFGQIQTCAARQKSRLIR
jgi:hypothetical protein